MYLKLRDIFQLIICMVMMFRNLIHYLLLIIGLTKKNNTCKKNISSDIYLQILTNFLFQLIIYIYLTLLEIVFRKSQKF
ncbi:hypothetical protein pb186bvf_008721 [Paramecium bursaria]